jgi:glyoxylase-like metal-dependent hydrolase (beta-lactamase superfamily II)
MVTVKVFCFNAFSENTFLIESNSNCIIVDPGCYESFEYKELTDYISEHNLVPQSIINTHCHIDHVLGVDYLKDHYNIPFEIGKNEIPVLQSAKLIAPVYGFDGFKEPEKDKLLTEGDEIIVGDSIWKVLDVPGHSPGHIALYEEKSKQCIAGDVLFLNSIGRTDLPGGDYNTLINSIREKLFILPNDVVVYPGHGPETTIGEEKVNNPFCGINI